MIYWINNLKKNLDLAQDCKKKSGKERLKLVKGQAEVVFLFCHHMSLVKVFYHNAENSLLLSRYLMFQKM